MFSANMRNIKRIQSYEEAKLRYEQIVPIRGRAGDIRPLGKRSNDSYRIAKQINVLSGQVSYQCILHSTPVVEFMPDGNVEIVMGGWTTASTREFIWRITGCSCTTKNGASVLHLWADNEVVLHSSNPTVIRRVEGYSVAWELVSSTPVYGIQLNKKKANAVRAKYSEFEKYVRAMIKLRTEEGGNMRMNLQEFVDLGLYTGDKEAKLQVVNWAVNRWIYAADKRNHKFNTFKEEIQPLMANDQPEDNKHANFYKASLILIAIDRGRFGLRVGRTPDDAFWVNTDAMLPRFRELVYKWHSDEVFEEVLAPTGVAPSKKYDSWV